MLVVILGYVFVKMSIDDEPSNILTDPAILSNNTTVNAYQYKDLI